MTRNILLILDKVCCAGSVKPFSLRNSHSSQYDVHCTSCVNLYQLLWALEAAASLTTQTQLELTTTWV